jgi:ribose 5-phosphate isomerase B
MSENKIIAIGSDHAGFRMKEFIKNKYSGNEYCFVDFGTNSEESVDYTDIAHPLAEAINKRKYEKGVLICGSGNGVAMVANKYKNIRAAICWNVEITELARKHNDANILVLPGRFISQNDAAKYFKIFMSTNFEAGRHLRRIEKI